jgi:hypothetical protein
LSENSWERLTEFGQGWQPAALHACALAQRDGRARPAFASGAEGGECNLIVLDAGDVLHDAFAVRRPGPAAKNWSTAF